MMDDGKVGGGIWSTSLLGSSSSSDALRSSGRPAPESLGDLVNSSCFNTILILMTQRRGSATQRCPNPQGP